MIPFTPPALKRWGWTVVTFGCALASSAGALAAPSSDALASSVTKRELIVRAAYERLANYVQGSGTPLRFELSDFRTYAPRQFAKLPWLKLVDMPGGAMIDMTRAVQQNDYLRTLSVVYKAAWSEHAGEMPAVQGGVDLASASASDVLGALSGTNAEMRQVEALTTFSVEATLEGRSRSYRAAFVWLPSSLTSYTLIVADNIVQGVEEAAREALPAGGPNDHLAIPAAGVLPAGGNTCTPSDTTQPFPYSQTGSTDHVWGSHSANASINVHCSCSAACASTCSASVLSSSCSESGFASDMCHKMATSTKESGDFKGNGHQTASACAAGVGCVKKSCLFCLCGLSISVSVSGVTVTFTPSSTVDWDANHAGSAVCPLCEVVPTGGGTGGGGGGGGGGTGGGGGGGMACNGTLYDFDCGNNGSWDFLEECVPAGQTAASIGCSLCFGSGLTDPGSALAAPQSNFVASCGSFAGGAGVGSGTVLAVPSTIVASVGGAGADSRK